MLMWGSGARDKNELDVVLALNCLIHIHTPQNPRKFIISIITTCLQKFIHHTKEQIMCRTVTNLTPKIQKLGFGFIKCVRMLASTVRKCSVFASILSVVLPASAQHSILEKGSKVKPLGSPMSVFTRILLFCPSKDDVSILGASRFQSVQYKFLWINGIAKDRLSSKYRTQISRSSLRLFTKYF